MEELSKTQSEGTDRLLEFDLSAELKHGIAVSNLVYALATELGLPHEQCYDLAIAGMLHDIGKLKPVKLHQRTGEEPSCDRGTEICPYAFHSWLRGTKGPGLFRFCS